MRSTRGKRVAAWSIGLGLVVLGGTGIALKEHLLDQLAISRLADEDAETRGKAATRLGKRRVARAVPALVAASKEEMMFVDPPAHAAIIKIGVAAVPGISSVLDGGDDGLRSHAAAVLMELHDSPDLRRALLHRRGRSASIQALRKVVRSLPDADFMVAQAASLLARMGPSARDAVPDLLEVLEAADEERWSTIADAIRQIDPEDLRLVPSVARRLRDGDALSRRAAAHFLECMGRRARAAISDLLAGLDHEDKEFSLSCLRALAAGGCDPAFLLPRFLDLLHGDDAELRATAIDALAAFGPAAKGTVPTLVRSLAEEDMDVVLASVSTLGSIGPDAKEAVPALLERLEDSEFGDERMDLARALGRIGSGEERTIRFLLKTLNGDHDGAREEAALALARIRPRRNDALLEALRRARADVWPLTSMYAAWALERIEPGALDSSDAIVEVFRDAVSVDQTVAVEALMDVPDLARALMPRLVGLLGASDEEVQIAAVRALGALGPEAAAAAPRIFVLFESSRPATDSGHVSSDAEEGWTEEPSAMQEACLEALERIQGGI
jgi:HEAT repeat protein